MDTISILCENDGKRHLVHKGQTLGEICEEIGVSLTDKKSGAKIEVLAAIVDNMLKALSYEVMDSCNVRFIGMDDANGRRCYIRSLCFVLQNAVRKVFPDKVLYIDYSLPSGLYCEIQEIEKDENGQPVVLRLTQEDINALKAHMSETIARNLPFSRVRMAAEDACAIFEANHQSAKAALQRSRGVFSCHVYYLDGQADSFHGPLVATTGQLGIFDLMLFDRGFCMRYPMEGNVTECLPQKPQSKLTQTLREHGEWCYNIGIKGLGQLNETIRSGRIREIINLSEARQERMFARIADKIYEQKDRVKIVFIAGPSSSGKTSSSKRLAQQCRILGMNPKVIELDNYFHNRENTPKDENGQYDFECLGAMNLELLGNQLNELLAGKRVELPRFDFVAGRAVYEGNFMQLEEKDILVMEGIHALNPAMVPSVDQSRIFRVYASALTSLNLDENSNISTADNRMLRRMVRDNRTRGINPEQTILRWHSVRSGENKNIFPFQENADALLNSAMIYELPMLKYYAEPLLRRIPANSPAYTEAVRQLKFLDYVTALTPEDMAAIPPASIMREFIGGQIL